MPDGTEIRINIPAGTDGVMVQDEDGNWYIEYGTDFGDVEIPVEYTEETAEGAEEETAEEETETEEQEETGSAAVSESSTSPATGAEIFGGIALILLLAFGIAFIVRRKSKE